MENDVEIEHRLTEVEQRSKSNTKRLDKLEESTEAISRLANSMEVMAVKQEQIGNDVSELGTKVDELEKKPAKRYEGLVEKIIWAVVAAALTYILGHIGL